MELPGFLKRIKIADMDKSFVRNHPGLILYLLITLLVIALFLEQNSLFENFENKIQDAMFSFRGGQDVGDDVVLLEIDDKAIDYLGWWPWSHGTLARMIEALDYYQPRAVYLDFRVKNNVDDYVSGNSHLLAENIQQSNNVIIPFEAVLGSRTPSTQAAPEWLTASSIKPGVISQDEIEKIQRIDLPENIFGQASRYLGADVTLFEKDNSVRYQPLILKYENKYYPSVELILASYYLGIDPDRITYNPGQNIQLDNRSIPVTGKGHMLINFLGKSNPFNSFSVKSLWEGEVPVEALENKLVIVTLTATGQYDHLKTPLSANMPPGIKTGTVIENIIRNNFINSFEASSNIGIIVILGIGLFCAFLLPRVALVHRFTILVVFLFVLVNINFILFSSFNTITKTLYPGFEILLFMAAAPMMKSKADIRRKEEKQRRASMQLRKNMTHEDEQGGERQRRAFTIEPEAQSKKRSERPNKVDEYAPTAAIDTQQPEQAAEETSEMSSFDHSVVNIDDAVIDQGVTDQSDIDLEHHRAAAELHTPSPDEKEMHKSPDASSTGRIQISFDESGRPSQFGRYKILDVVGQGAMGTVYKGLDPAIGRPVALKTIRFDRLANPDEIEELRERFMLEAKAAGNFSHPHIVTIYDVGQDKNIQYIAMEYLEGRTLDNIIKRKQDFNFKIVASVISQVCSALAYAHERHVIHRDIKPANIMVLDGFRVKVMDFGIAHFESSNMTQTGVAMGTPNYISPEQLSGKEVTKSSDIFSLGVVMYEMLAGERPFEGENLNNLIVKILNHEPERPSKIDPKVPPLLDHVVMRALEKDPLKRFQSATEMENSLRDFISMFAPKAVRY
ncbi:MAG: CHASE2 domain-containing protein [candidate division Zixibacteria bacterium]|nr:CHASE2 domain-containing protein [candidate division Zixibacteria bacterium]NIR63843.1 CHASE2 domain-containing protein [candidate division Zixibacteria bacterium]NIS14962.1 CHASE2 domain-containing protein [candidate division Zixibacteria bacterium]NIS45799.1 CHASE2 domain-containing protein [candidate division Zixibacteria bacterium]NIT51488.1 CHASE2 domain-containing protein [candidate division Zixibacteria bacterium]